MLRVDATTVRYVRERFVMGGIDAALYGAPSAYRPERKLSSEALDRLIGLAASPPPNGGECWTYQQLADRLVEPGIMVSVSREMARKALKEVEQKMNGRSGLRTKRG